MFVPSDFPAAGYVEDYLVFWALWLAAIAGTVLFFRRTRGRTGRLRLVAGNALVLLSLVWTLVLAGETYLRYFYDASDSYGLTLTNVGWFTRHVEFNSDGFRDREEWPLDAKEGVTRVACVGDSFTVGYGVPDVADVWPQRVAAALGRAQPGRFDVHNCGLIGRDTGHELDLVQFLGGLHPTRKGPRVAEHVILAYCLNDVDDLMPEGIRFNRVDAPRVTWMKPWRSFVFDFFWFRLKLLDDPRVQGYSDWVDRAYTDEKLMRAQTERFEAIAGTCARAGMRLDVVVFPFFSGWGEGYRWDAAHDLVAAAWKSAGVDVIDLRAAYRGIPGTELVVNRFDAHPNERAHEIAARVVLDRVFGVR